MDYWIGKLFPPKTSFFILICSDCSWETMLWYFSVQSTVATSLMVFSLLISLRTTAKWSGEPPFHPLFPRLTPFSLSVCWQLQSPLTLETEQNARARCRLHLCRLRWSSMLSFIHRHNEVNTIYIYSKGGKTERRKQQTSCKFRGKRRKFKIHLVSNSPPCVTLHAAELLHIRVALKEAR